MFDYNALQLRNKVIIVNTVCYSIFLYEQMQVLDRNDQLLELQLLDKNIEKCQLLKL